MKIQKLGIPQPKDRPNHSTIQTMMFGLKMLMGDAGDSDAQRAVRLGELLEAGVLKFNAAGAVDTGGGLVHIEGAETIKGQKTFAAPIIVSNSGATLLELKRTPATINTTMAFSNDSGTLYAGYAGVNNFAVGTSPNLAVTANQYFAASPSGMSVNGVVIATGRVTGEGGLTHAIGGGYLVIGSYDVGAYGNGSINCWYNFNAGTLSVPAHLALGNNSGVSVGSTLAASITDVSKHLALHGATTGIAVTNSLLTINIGSIGYGYTTAAFRPATDNNRTLGASGLRWSVVWAGSPSISTSDARDKTPIRLLNAAELAAGYALLEEIGIYQWLASIEAKGVDGARLHPGTTVQRAIEILQAHGLDPFRYSFICYDQWDAQEELHDEDGGLLQEAREAGDTYSFRGEALTQFMLAALYHKMKPLLEQP